MHALIVLSIIVGVNILVWVIIIHFIKKRAASQVESFGTVDASLTYGKAVAGPGHSHYIGTTVNGFRYFAKGYWARGTGSVVLTDRALIIKRKGLSNPAVIPLQSITELQRRKSFAGRHLFKPVVTVIMWEMGGGDFETGIVLGRNEETHSRWESAISAYRQKSEKA